MSEAIRGIDTDAINRWFSEHLDDVQLPLDVSLIAGGHSNLTYSLTEQSDRQGQPARRWVLRRPPLGQVLATAHDMGREFKIISALSDSLVPVPKTVGLSPDDSVNGSPFYVMDFVDGIVIRSAEQAEALTPEARRRAGESLIEVMGEIHAVDVDSVGLGDLAKKQDYIARQLKRWHSQFEKSESQVEGGLGLPAVHEAHRALSAAIPPQTEATIVHGDYRLDNCMVDSDGNVIAVLDWEICTLGEPLADVGLFWVYWTDPGEVAVMPQASPTSLPGFPTRLELMELYEARTGRDLTNLPYFVAFGYWKLTCIIAGVYARYAGGSMGDVPDSTVQGFRWMLDTIADATTEAVERIGSDWRAMAGGTTPEASGADQ